MKIVVTGADGLLGPFLTDGLATLGTVVPMNRARGDLRDAVVTQELLRGEQPDVVIHTAAYTDVAGCERDPERARLDNREATRHVADACRTNTQLIYVSTDQVYPDVEGPHREDLVAPVNVYGRTKLEGERAALLHPRALVLRTNFFAESRSPGRASLSDVIVRTLSERRRFPGFTDSLFSPLHADTLAAQIGRCISDGLTGVYNLGCRAGCSKADFARLVARHLGLDEHLVESTLSTQVSGRAPRASDLRMDVTAYMDASGILLPTLDEEVDRL